jgi:hypothetical protein
MAGVLAACRAPYDVCAPIDAGRLDHLPARLSETGLFVDMASGMPAQDVRAYRPAFELWSDGASKRRWIRLPSGTQIDTSDMDDWRFPPGTRLWKEFTVGGVRVETRMIEKFGPGDDDWAGVAYVWTPDQSDALAAPEGATDAQGTPHDVPSASACVGCHGGRRSVVLGFSAIQLSPAAVDGEFDLAGLTAASLLSAPPSAPFVVPGDATTRAALGYLHANCSHCHNQARPERSGPRCYDPEKPFDFRLTVGQLGAVDDTPTMRTARGRAFRPGDPDGSKMITLVSRRGAQLHMPPLATEQVDPQGVDLLRRWIAGM